MITFLVVIFFIIPLGIMIAYVNTKPSLKNNIKFIKETKLAGEEIFNKNTHRYWKKTVDIDGFGEVSRNIILKFIFKSGKVVYSFSNYKGEFFYPKKGEIVELNFSQHIHPKRKLINNIIKVYSLFILISPSFVYPLINRYKKLNDPIRLMRIEANEKHKLYADIIHKKTDSVLENNEYLYVFTNDTLLKEARLDLNYRFFDNIYNHTLAKANYLENFIKKEDTLGYNVLIKKGDRWLKGQNLKKIDTTIKLKLIVDYDISSEEAQLIEKLSKDTRYRHLNIKPDTSKHRTEGMILTYNEIRQHQLKSYFKETMKPTIDLSNSSYKFYFLCYNKALSEKELFIYIDDFKIMFLKNNECKGCFIKKIKLTLE